MLHVAPWKIAMTPAVAGLALAASLSACEAEEHAQTVETSEVIRLVYEVDFSKTGAAETLTEMERAEARDEVMDILRDRAAGVDLFPVSIAANDDDEIFVELQSGEDSDLFKTLSAPSAQLSIQVVASEDRDMAAQYAAGDVAIPAGLELLQTDDPYEPYLVLERRLRPEDTVPDSAGEPEPLLSGRLLQSASFGYHPQTGQPVVNFQFNAAGSEIFSKLTANHVGERIAVVIDGEVVTAPRVLSPISDGAGFIEGNFTLQTASTLAAALDAGALRYPLTLVEERVAPGGSLDDRPASSHADTD